MQFVGHRKRRQYLRSKMWSWLQKKFVAKMCGKILTVSKPFLKRRQIFHGGNKTSNSNNKAKLKNAFAQQKILKNWVLSQTPFNLRAK